MLPDSPLFGSAFTRTGPFVFGSGPVPTSSAVQRSTDIAGRLTHGLEDVLGLVCTPTVDEVSEVVVAGDTAWANAMSKPPNIIRYI